MTLVASIGKYDPEDKRSFAEITKTWRGEWPAFVDALIKNVPVTRDKANNGWVCGAEFKPEYRHGSNFVARHFVSLDYDHIKPEHTRTILDGICTGHAFLAYTTWSHVPDQPRIRVWIPLTRAVGAEEYQAIARKLADRAGINLAARESFTPAQFMFRPCRQKDTEFQVWQDVAAPPLDADTILGEYSDWKNRSLWPRRADEEALGVAGEAGSPLEKPGIVGDFCRAFTITAAIERFGLPYVHHGGERWTYTAGSRPEGAIVYDDDTKLHSHHDTDPASGQHNAFDLVRLHRFAALDTFDADRPIGERPSQQAMAALAMEQPEVAVVYATIWTDLDAEAREAEVGAPRRVDDVDARAVVDVAAVLPARIPKGSSLCSDQENARRIQAIYGTKLIAAGKEFYVWMNTHWVKDDAPVDRMIAELSTFVQREAELAMTLGKEGIHKELIKWANACCSHDKRATCSADLKSFLDFKAENLNVDRALFNCRTGTIDLRTGAQRPHRQDDFITTCAPTEYDPQAKAPRFQQFLLEIFQGDRSLIAFAKRWFGYCITGEVNAHAMVFHVGDGSNGKGRLMAALQNTLGAGYMGVGPRQMLHSKMGASPEVAGLLGKRMVTMSESKQDEEFDQGILKELTGADRLTARNLHKGYFEFAPTHKLQLFTNDEPRITGQDEGIWRRIFLLSYDVKFGTEAQVAAGTHHRVKDEWLDSKLALEAPGILAWLIEGAIEWYAHGLQAPALVMKRTQDFRAEQDHTGQFLKERTIRDAKGSVAITHGSESLYSAYRGWMREMNYYALGRNRFLKSVKRAAPYVSVEKSGTVTGLRLATEELPEERSQLPAAR